MGLIGASFAGLLLPGKAIPSEPLRFPDVSVHKENGQETSLHKFYGKPLILNVWAAFCRPCIEEIPLVNKLAAAHNLLGLYMMSGGTLEEELLGLQTIKRNHAAAFQNLVVPTGSSSIINKAYVRHTSSGYLPVPTFFVLDPIGDVQHISVGTLDRNNNYARLEQAIVRLEEQYK
tara:strand:- start:22 stop:546 length:525 start_codon:yes stop_codon:yes gene_type:complete